MKINSFLLRCTLIAALGGFLFGFETAVISGAEKTIQQLWSLSDFWLGFTVAASLIGTVIGSGIFQVPGAVLAQFRDRGVGRRLKLFQRQDALKRGIDLIEWTFDPLEVKNAHFNFVRLGAVARRYIPDCYGVTASPLHGGLPTDRLVAEWWLSSERVKSILADDAHPMDAAAERVSIPANLTEIKGGNRGAAARAQAQAREHFQKWFAKGYVATGVESRVRGTDYLLEPAAAIRGLRLPELAGI